MKLGHIIDSIRHIESSDHAYRSILPARAYLFPPCSKKELTEQPEPILLPTMSEEDPIPLDLFFSNTYNGISRMLIQALAEEENIDLFHYTVEECEKINQRLGNMVSSLPDPTIGNMKPYTATTIDKKGTSKKHLDYYYVPTPKEKTFSINFFLDDFYAQKEQTETFTNYRNSLLRVILASLQKYTKRLANMNLKLQECENKDQYRIYGELLTANLYQLKENTKQATVFNYYNNEEITIPLDTRYSPSVNAKRFFKKYNKLKNTLEIVGKQKQETKIY